MRFYFVSVAVVNGKLAFPLAGAICFQLRDPRCPADWDPCRYPLVSKNNVSKVKPAWKFVVIDICVHAYTPRFSLVILKCFVLLRGKLGFETDSDPVTHSTAAPVGSFTKAVTFTWQVVRDEPACSPVFSC